MMFSQLNKLNMVDAAELKAYINRIVDDVWGYVSESGEDTVKTHISRLRNRLKDVDDFQIITIKGLGYKAELVKEKEQ